MNPSLLLNAERKRSKRIVLVQEGRVQEKGCYKIKKFRRVEK